VSPVLRALLGIGAGLLACAGATAARAGAPAPCSASARFDVERATLGQQVVYRVHILSREDVASVDWADPPSFPGFRAEWLPARPQAEPVLRAGVRYRAREERRALFPERPGELRVEPAGLRCRVTGASGEQTFAAPVPAATLRAVAPPAEAGPPGFAGLIGPIALQTLATPRAVRLGETVRVAVMLRGSGNLWDAPDPLADIAEADLFRRRPELTLETGPRLGVKRHFAYDVVPLREGALVIPAIHIPYFDPSTGRFAAATSEAMHVSVGPRASAAPVPTQRAADTTAGRRIGPPPAAASRTPGKPWWAIAGAVLAAAAAGLVVSHDRRRKRRTRAAFESALGASEAGGNEAAVLARALRAALAHRIPEAPSLTAEEIAALPALPASVCNAAHLLADVERARFDPNAAIPSRDDVRRAVAKL
jgi:hypothetical protein